MWEFYKCDMAAQNIAFPTWMNVMKIIHLHSEQHPTALLPPIRWCLMSLKQADAFISFPGWKKKYLWQHICHSTSASFILVSYYFSQTVWVRQFETLLNKHLRSTLLNPSKYYWGLIKEFPRELNKWRKCHVTTYLFSILKNTAVLNLHQ